MNRHTLNELNQRWLDSKTADSKLESEMRSNIQLFAGEHYSRRTLEFMSRVRDSQQLTKDQRLRITKNHIQRIMLHYINSVLTAAPTAKAVPDNESELQDVKASELHNSVIAHLRKKYDLHRRTRYMAQDFFVIGEVWYCIFFNPAKGRLLGYEQAVDSNGQPVFDETGNPAPGEKAVFSGDLEIKRVYGYQIRRPKSSETIADAPWLGFDEMVSKKDLLAAYEGDSDKQKIIHGASSEKLMIFDPGNGSYGQSGDDVCIRYCFERPCLAYPEGWYSISTSSGILEDGPLPFGLFPLDGETCDEFQGSMRGRSRIKVLRPYQAEINRASSKMAEHQVTLGDDKLILTNGSKVTQGAALPGIRTVYTTGSEPKVIEGRTGDQFLPYIESQIREMYQAGLAEELLADNPSKDVDPYAALFKNLRQKKEFSVYVDKFEQFQVRFYTNLLEHFRAYASEDEIIQMLGKSEIINISEFKNAEPIGYQITVEPMSEDIDTIMGKQLAFNHILQFVGPNLTRNDLGKIIAGMPLLPEGKQIFGDLVIDDENATNDILQLDRGELPIPRKGIDKEYTITKLTARQKKSDYQFLPPQIQQNYDLYIANLNALLIEEQAAIKAMNADLIPAQGFLTSVDFYVPDPKNPGSNKRARLPIDSIAWLIERLEAQGMALDRMEQMQQSAVGNLAMQAQAVQGASAQGQASQELNDPFQGGNLNGNSQ